ncbi:MAG TPA: hypothetical protein VG142_02825 [Trebonia sp.]|nr:hypothetical protein [Trebonia sp.]
MLDAMGPEGDFVKQHLINPVVLRMLGDVRGRRILDAGCGHGYFSRMLASEHLISCNRPGSRAEGVKSARLPAGEIRAPRRGIEGFRGARMLVALRIMPHVSVRDIGHVTYLE